MEVITTNSSGSPRPARRRRRWPIAAAAFALLFVIQSITITLPIHGRVLDGTSGQPVPGAAVAALWQLDAWTPAQVVPGGPVRIIQAVTRQDGTFELPMAVLIHLPLLPFSPLVRTDSEMPVLMVVADGYHPQSENNEGRWAGFLSLRVSFMQSEGMRLAPLPPSLDAQQFNEYQRDLESVRTAVELAVGSCASRWYCRGDSLAEVRGAIERGMARTRSN